ncbi:MAG: polyphenol oxidase family protein [Chthoniobacteraceae bacterium]
MPPCPFETFPALSALPVIHALSGRVPGLDVQIDREAALRRLASYHDELRAAIGAGGHRYVTAEQVHGAEVGVVTDLGSMPVRGVDALVTDNPGVCLGIYVADCGPVWLVDPIRRAIGCVHSGRKGTDLGVVPATIETMVKTFGCEPSRMVAQLGPCIRPPHYEVDFAAAILAQCRAAGIGAVFDSGACTAAQSDRYYSYRREQGRTGRMVAFLALA